MPFQLQYGHGRLIRSQPRLKHGWNTSTTSPLDHTATDLPETYMVHAQYMYHTDRTKPPSRSPSQSEVLVKGGSQARAKGRISVDAISLNPRMYIEGTKYEKNARGNTEGNQRPMVASARPSAHCRLRLRARMSTYPSSKMEHGHRLWFREPPKPRGREHIAPGCSAVLYPS